MRRCDSLEKVRLFFAIHINPDIKKEIQALMQTLQKFPLQAKWVSENQLHVTLFFLGDVEKSKIQPLVAATQRVLQDFPPFHIFFQEIGFFPARENPRVLWLGIQGQVAQLKRLHTTMGFALKEMNIKVEERAFFPHLTLARIKNLESPWEFREAVKKLRQKISLSQKVASVELVQSLLRPQGPFYTIVASCHFKTSIEIE